jgi:hypothetical protein
MNTSPGPTTPPRDFSAVWYAMPLLTLFMGMAVISLWPPDAAQPAAARTATAPDTAPPAAPQRLQGLRDAALLGDSEASADLVASLLREDTERKPEALFEAMFWLDRDWHTNAYRRVGLMAQVFEEHCSEPRLQWHWLCAVGE